MSRCFPFPPPGYILNGIRDEAVIKSIKGVEEKSKKEQVRKERKREKKEKKRKEKEGNEGETGKKRSSHKRRRKEEGQNQKVVKENEIEYLEKSSLTIEHELLQTTSQNSCDSTHNNNELLPKQQKEKQSLNRNELSKQQIDGRHNNDSESTIRIRLPIRRQKDLEMMVVTNKDQQKLNPSLGIKLDSSSSQHPTREQRHCSTSASEHASKPSKEKRKEKKISSFSTQETYQPSSLCSLCPPSLALQFMNVVENWVPNTIEKRVEDEECWWLSKKPSNHKFDTERCKQFNKEMTQVSSSMAWPCARLLPEADVYSLPYTVPF